jgi:hypothetical protein
MARAALLLCAAATAAAAAAATPLSRNSFCFPRAYGPEANPICIKWGRDGADFVFELQCTPESFPEFSISWCAVGFSTGTPPGAPVPPVGSWHMFPSDIIHLQVVNTTAAAAAATAAEAAAAAAAAASGAVASGASGAAASGARYSPSSAFALTDALSVVVTDRVATSVKMPACLPKQATRLLNASLSDRTGMLTAFFARAAELSPALLQQGYTNLNRTLPLVAAISNGGANPAGGCGSTFAPHDNEWRNETIDFSK